MTADDVHDRDGFVRLLAQMRKELSAKDEAWQNIELAAFLEAMAAWAHDLQRPTDANPWTLAAKLMQAGAFYE